MEISAINLISKHKFAKLMRSKIYLVFFIFGLGTLLMIIIPFLADENFRSGGPAAFMLIYGFTQTYSFFGIFASITIGALVLVQDIRDGTLFPYLAKPISRSEFIFGKILGSFKIMLVFWIFQVVYFLILLYVATEYGITINLVLAFIFDLLIYFMLISVTAFFSVIMNPVWAGIIVLVTIYLPLIAKFAIHTNFGFWTTLARIFWFIGPEYNVLDNWGNIIASTMIYDTSLIQKLAYYITLLLLVLIPTFYLFTKRNLNPRD